MRQTVANKGARVRAAIGKLVQEAQFVRHKTFNRHNRRRPGGGHRRARANKINAPSAANLSVLQRRLHYTVWSRTKERRVRVHIVRIIQKKILSSLDPLQRLLQAAPQ